MAFTWSNINNNENAKSIRNKLNALGADYATTEQSTSTQLNSLNNSVQNINTQIIAINGVLQKLNAMMSISTNVNCPVAQWAEDTAKTYENFPYKADLYIAGVTADMVPIVNFAATEQESGNYTGSESTTNVVSIWAKEIPSAALTIPNIVLLKAVNG